jgi:hypothetical protein
MASKSGNQVQQHTATTNPLSSGILQRQCATCGQHTIAGGECEECQKNYSEPPSRSLQTPFPPTPPVEHNLGTLQRTERQQDFTQIPIQAKLTVGEPGDKYEQEADHMAELVTTADIIPPVQRQQLLQEDEENTLQAKEQSGQTPEVTPELATQLQTINGGEPLSEATRAFVEPRFGYDFTQVRLHTDSSAADAAQQLHAQAFTHKHHIFFGEGKYQPESTPGKRLLAHELTHVVQQGVVQKSDQSVNSQPQKVDILPGYLTSTVQLDPGEPTQDILPEPVEVNWGGDRFQIEFQRTDRDGGRLEFVIKYLGLHKVDGPFVENKTQRLSTMIGTAKLNARVVRQTSSLIEVDLYGDGSRLVKLIDTVSFDDRLMSRGREHDFKVQVLGKSVAVSSFWVLDPNAKASDIPISEPEESPGENPKSILLKDFSTTEIRLDGDGDQYKELILRIRAKSYWADQTYKDIPQTLLVQLVQISTKQVREITVEMAKPTIRGSLFPIVEEVTDGLAPTKVSLVIPSKTQWLEIYPPERTSKGVDYHVVVAGRTFSFQFPPEKSEIHKVASPGLASVIGNIVSVDVGLGAYRDRFRLTVQPIANDRAIFGISALYRGEPVGGLGAELKINAPVKFQVLLTGDVSLGLDLNGDKKPDFMIYDRLTTPAEYDGGGPPESNRNHQIRVTGAAIGGEKLFYFRVRNGVLFREEGKSTADKAAVSNAKATSGLQQQAAEGSFENQLDAYEAALMAERKKAADAKLIDEKTYNAWFALSLALIKLRPQISKTVNSALQTEAATQAEAFYKSLKAETRYKTKPVFTGSSAASTSVNPYTGEMTTIASFYSSTTGAGPELADDIKASRWSQAFAKYQKLVSGLDQWILERLKQHKGEFSQEAQRLELLTERKRELGAIERHNPRRILAVFHPSEKFQTEQGYISEFPLAIYYWKEGNTWHLKDITNPKKTYDYTVGSVDNEQEPPLALLNQLNDPDHFPVGVIHYQIPDKYGGQIKTQDYLTWKKFFTYLGLGLAAVGLTLSTFGTGTVAVAGAWVLAGSALASATAATIDLIERGQQGNLDTTTAIIDIAQIVGSLAGASALASGRIVQAAANAPAGARWAGNWARLAMFANKLYIPMVGTTAVADVVSFAVIAQDTAKQLDEIENGPGDRTAKNRAKALLLSQLAVMGGLTALSAKGTIPQLTKGRTLVLHPGPNGVPVVTTALAKQSVVIDSNTAIALDRKAKGLPLNKAQEDAIKRIESMGDVELRVADPTIGEVGFKGGPVTQQGVPVSTDRKGKAYQDILQDLKNPSDPVGGHKLPKAESDQQIVADTFFAVSEPGVIPRFVTADSGIYNPLSRRAGYDPLAKGAGIAVPLKFPNGFDVTINGRTIRVIALPKVK